MTGNETKKLKNTYSNRNKIYKIMSIVLQIKNIFNSTYINLLVQGYVKINWKNDYTLNKHWIIKIIKILNIQISQ